jgi:glucokinase
MPIIRNAKLVLAGDIGGTKTNLGLFIGGGGRPRLAESKTYRSGEASGLEEVIDDFLRGVSSRISAACFGIAGPIVHGETKTTNLPWVVSEAQITNRFGWPTVRLINDLAATILALPLLTDEEIRHLNRGSPEPEGNIGVVAPGTGLGIGLGIVRQGRIHPIPSEGGHADFAPRNEQQLGLLQSLLSRTEHVSVERLASGPGILTIYSWLKESRGYDEPDWLREKMRSTDPSEAISSAALEEREPHCVETLNFFVSILGAAAGNLALTAMTSGGLYLGGGIAPKILPKLEDGTFMEAFTAKGRFKELLSRIPVRVILNDEATLLGAASCALTEAD